MLLRNINYQLLVSLIGTIAFVLSLLFGPGLLGYLKKPSISISFETKITKYYSQRREFEGEIKQPSKECFTASYLFVKITNKKGFFSDSIKNLNVSCLIKAEDIKLNLISVDFNDYRLKGEGAVVTPNPIQELYDEKRCLSSFYNQVFGEQVGNIFPGDALYYPLFKSASVIESIRLYTNQSVLLEKKIGEDITIALLMTLNGNNDKYYKIQKNYTITFHNYDNYMIKETK